MTAWEWLSESKNQQVLMFIGTGVGAVVAGVGTVLIQLGWFEPKIPSAKPAVAAAPTSAAASTVNDESLRILLEVLAHKEQSDKAEFAFKQESKAWDAARELNTLAGHQAYLADYPKGGYARLAHAAIEKLSNTAPNSTSPPDVKPKKTIPAKKHPHPLTKSELYATQAKNSLAQKSQPSVSHTAHLIVKCIEGSKLYVDGSEKGRITTDGTGSFTIEVPSGKHDIILVSRLGILQQHIELLPSKSLRINPAFCN